MLRALVICLISLFPAISIADIYTWEDENGTHFADDIASVPSRHRKQAMKNSRSQSDDNDISNGTKRAGSNSAKEKKFYDVCKYYIESRLLAPNSAAFQDFERTEKYYDKNMFVILINVDGEASSGALVRNRFGCVTDTNTNEVVEVQNLSR